MSKTVTLSDALNDLNEQYESELAELDSYIIEELYELIIEESEL